MIWVVCDNSAQRAKLSLEICKIRKHIRTRWLEIRLIEAAKYGRAPPSPRTNPKYYALRDPATDELLDDPEDIAIHIEDFFHKIFNDDSDKLAVPCWIHNTSL